ncbi:DUF5412 family protein [Hazenella coriacea]|uniref:Uncharacterized protein n=1 Tax=Hazenella coriacea TaxID=1179467 RepID=A0A4R3L7Y8_9BACL|nr:DUF5412 family protein [Hazenella coriacea]TCS95749.1 hypothetical protein EDD58_102329 [Hazenella coriacea]
MNQNVGKFIHPLAFGLIGLIFYQGERAMFTMIAVGVLIGWSIDECLHHLESKNIFRTPTLLNYKWVKAIISIPIMLFSILASLGVMFTMFLHLIAEDRLIKEIFSPDGAYTIQIYEPVGMMPDYSSYVDVVFNDELRDSRRIYWQGYSQDLNVVWVSEDMVDVNGRKLNVYKDAYKESGEDIPDSTPEPPFFSGFHYSGQSPHWNVTLSPDGEDDYKNIKLEYRGTDPETVQNVHLNFKLSVVHRFLVLL